MSSAILSKVEDNLKKYQADHKGEKPLYILVSPYEADALFNALKTEQGVADDVVLTEFQGSKIVKYDALKQGDLRLTNELPGD
ncbi:MAG TPA: hypothetical protein VGD65_21870 [Chryseosolibacter sp.]